MNSLMLTSVKKKTNNEKQEEDELDWILGTDTSTSRKQSLYFTFENTIFCGI